MVDNLACILYWNGKRYHVKLEPLPVEDKSTSVSVTLADMNGPIPALNVERIGL